MTAFCVAVDWGTSNFRIWLLDESGKSIAARRSSDGLLQCIPDRFASVLETHLQALGAAADLPVIICGMAGSRQGWIEVPYCVAPAGLVEIAAEATLVPGNGRPVRIMPGLAQRDPDAADVMRGEETQLLGAFSGSTGPAIACLPGTHSKWVAVHEGQVVRFRTFMTGDLFAAIRDHTILAHSGARLAEGHNERAFEGAVKKALKSPAAVAAELFAIRGRELLGFAEPNEAASALSGLLVGGEIAGAAASGFALDAVTLIASGPLAARYRVALEIAGATCSLVDADKAVLTGLFTAARHWFGSEGAGSPR